MLSRNLKAYLILFFIFFLTAFTQVYSSCDCLGYFLDSDGVYHRIPHSHGTSICVGYAFSSANSYIGEPIGPRENIYIDVNVASNYYRDWGFYQISNTPSEGKIAIWCNEDSTIVDHASILSYWDSAEEIWMIDEVQGKDGSLEIGVRIDEYKSTPPNFYLSQSQLTYGYKVKLETSFSGGEVEVV